MAMNLSQIFQGNLHASGALGGQLGGFAQQNTGTWNNQQWQAQYQRVNLTTGGNSVVQAKAIPVAPKDIGLLWLEGRVNEITDMGQALL